ncbi:MAG: Gfo/Idh/MocA family oxidoreductase [Planctomycetes bacterium]|nr:Gfo/Idh/MocA family oxidoreductase [Planctomycetota bacterium]
MRKIKWAVVGSCGIARRRTIPEGILRASNVELAVVYDVNTAGNEELARKLGVKAAGSLAELLDSDAQAVYVATPANLHCRQVLACAKAKKHVLCEKPLGLTVAEAGKMIRACRAARVKLGTAFMMRFQSQHQAALKLIKAGRLGKCVYGRAQLSCWYPPIKGVWRQDPKQGGGGSLMDLGGHCIDLLEMFFGDIDRVSCFINRGVHRYRSEDSATAMLYFRSGAIATVDAFFCIPDNSSKNILELYGTLGSILARGTIGQGESGEMTAFLEAGPGGYDAAQARRASAGLTIAPPPVNMYRAEIEEFSRAILDGRASAVDAIAGLRSQRILAACYRSAKTLKAVKV